VPAFRGCTMADSQAVRSFEYRAMLRIVGELGELPADPIERRTHALRSLCRLLGGAAGFFAETKIEAGCYRIIAPASVGLESLPPGHLDAYFRGELPLDPCGTVMEGLPDERAAAATRREIVPDDVWYRHAHYATTRGNFGLDDAVYARLDDRRSGRVFGMCVIRAVGDRPFGARQREILRLFNGAAAPLYRLSAGDGPDPLAGLSPRLRSVAECFLRGLTIKETAAELGLSPATVMSYSKPLYRALGVRSRPEMLAKLLPAGEGRRG